MENVFLAFILTLSILLGLELISKVPSTLHTPLMSGANAISGITLVGALLAAGSSQTEMGIILGTAAVFFATHQRGGRLLRDESHAGHVPEEGSGLKRMTIWINWVYILSALLFGLGLKMLSSPATARRGNLVSAVAMFLAVASTLFHHQIIDLRWIAGGVVAGAVVGWIAARFVTMTAMPEMVALFNGFGGIASLLVAWAEFQARDR